MATQRMGIDPKLAAAVARRRPQATARRRRGAERPDRDGLTLDQMRDRSSGSARAEDPLVPPYNRRDLTLNRDARPTYFDSKAYERVRDLNQPIYEGYGTDEAGEKYFGSPTHAPDLDSHKRNLEESMSAPPPKRKPHPWRQYANRPRSER